MYWGQSPTAGALTGSSFNDELQVGLLFFDDAIALHAMGCSQNSFKAWICDFRQADLFSEWGNKIWTQFCTERGMKLQFQRAGAHP